MSDTIKSKDEFRFGPYVPILRSDQRIVVDVNGVVDYYMEKSLMAKKLLGEILPDDSIVEAPSMVVPFLLKKKTIWPSRVCETESPKNVSDNKNPDRDVEMLNGGDDDEEIQLIKIIDRGEPKYDATPKKFEYVKDYIKAAVVQKLSNSHRRTLAIPDYYQSSGNDIISTIGMNLVSEFVLEDRYKRLATKVKRGSSHLINEANSVKTHLIEAKISNRSLKIDQTYRCSHCQFKAESRSVFDAHLEELHKINSRCFICNWCSFKTKDKNQIIYHTYIVHKRRSHVKKPVPTHCCRYCDFETNSKVKYTNHLQRCERVFDSSTVQSMTIVDYAAVTPKFITQDDIRAYEEVLKNLRLAAYNPHQIEVTAHDSQNVFLIPKGVVNIRPVAPQSSISQLSSPFTSNLNCFSAKTSSLSNQHSNQMHQIVHDLMASGASSSNIPANRVSILQHPKPTSAFTNGIFVVQNAENVVIAPAQNQQVTASQPRESEPPRRAKKGSQADQKHQQTSVITIDYRDEGEEVRKESNDSFVICEICDTYIEGITEFMIHMGDVHQVKIQRKLIAKSRPPLSCQRCNWRFFTDQGLDRHLLGSHGLVTASMQDKADKHIDSGRCTICGRKFANKLVSHVKDSHKVLLKPAQLTYKCKVCSAIFGLYSHFENHVQQLHSDTIANSS